MPQSIRRFSNRQQTVRRWIVPGVRCQGRQTVLADAATFLRPEAPRASSQCPDSDQLLSYSPSSNQCGPRQDTRKARYRQATMGYGRDTQTTPCRPVQAETGLQAGCDSPAPARGSGSSPRQAKVRRCCWLLVISPHAQGLGPRATHLFLKRFSSVASRPPSSLVAPSLFKHPNDQAVPSARARMSTDKGPLHRHFEPHQPSPR